MRSILSLCVVALALTGCGGTAGDTPDADTTLLLGGPPSAIHVGIYLAVSRGYDETEGISLTVRRSGDAAQLLRNGRVQAAILTADQIEDDEVCVMQLRPGGPYLCVLRTQLEDRRAEVRGLVQALQRGYSEAAIDPESAVQAVVAAAPSTDTVALEAELDGFRGSLEARPPPDGPEFDGSLVQFQSRD